MANSRPASMIISSSVFDETNTNGPKTPTQKKELLSTRSTNQEKLPTNNLINAHSSSSSIDSAGAKNAISNEKISLAQMNSIATVSTTTTDSELESEQEEQDMDDNHLSESNNLPRQIQQQQASRRDSGQHKSDGNTQEQLSRRVKHFHKLFKSEIPDDMPALIDSYVCAYQGDILLQGKMYITDRYLCFHSRIISYVTKHVYRWEQIENVTKERVAFIFPTAIGIQLKRNGKKIIYASFLQRDQAFDKVISICSRFSNDTNSLQDDDENRSTQGGTIKGINSNHDKRKKSKRDRHYEMLNELEQDNVLQMCLGDDRTINNIKRRPQSVSSKSSDDKQIQSRKLFNSDKKKSTMKNSNMDQILSNDSNEIILDNNQQKQTSTSLNNPSVVYRQPHNTSLRTHRSCSHGRTSSPSNRPLSSLPHSNSSSNLMPNIDSSIINSTNDGSMRKYYRIIILSVISIIKVLIDYLLLLYNQFKTYPIKTSLILLIFITILILHSFYLIKLAYRIENRLQSLHHMWPSSSMKNSLPSLKEL